MDVIAQAPLAPLPEHNGRTLVTFVFHKMDVNVNFFLKCGVVRHANVDYCIVENTDLEAPSLVEHDYHPSKLYWMKRPNSSQCFGGYSASARTLTEPYQYRFFINSTMRGPMLPTWAPKDKFWLDYFTERFSESVAMVGSSINIDPDVHVQSMMMGVDQRALRILVENKIFLPEDTYVDKKTLIYDHEVYGTQLVLKQGYNIDCMITAFQGRDWQRERVKPYDELVTHDLWDVGAYYGQSLHPYETIFFKTVNRNNFAQADVISYFIGMSQKLENGCLPALIDTTFREIALRPVIESPISKVTVENTERQKRAVNRNILILSVACAVLGLAFLTFLVLYLRR